jgi:hypothetical protein
MVLNPPKPADIFQLDMHIFNQRRPTRQESNQTILNHPNFETQMQSSFLETGKEVFPIDEDSSYQKNQIKLPEIKIIKN